jgi:hypothetical protein
MNTRPNDQYRFDRSERGWGVNWKWEVGRANGASKLSVVERAPWEKVAAIRYCS